MIRQERCRLVWESEKGKQGRSGLVYLTDHRLIFEAETGGLHSRKLVTELEQPLEERESSFGVRDLMGISPAPTLAGLDIGENPCKTRTYRGLAEEARSEYECI